MIRRKLSLLLPALLLPGVAFAQDITGLEAINGTTGLSDLPAAQAGAVDPAAFAIFETLYQAVLGGIGDVITNGVGVIIGYVHDFFVPMATLGVIMMAIVEVCGAGVYLFWLTKYLVRAGVVMTFIDTAGDYAKWIITPIANMGDNIAAALNGVTAGAPGHIYDVLMAHYAAAVTQTIDRLPWSSVTGSIESLCLGIGAELSWVFAFIAVGICFAIDIILHLYLAGTLIVGPLFIACGMAGQLRNWLMGWLNALASLVLAKVLLGVGMSILTKAEDQTLQSIMNIADNANFWSSIGHLFGGVTALFLGAVFAITTRSIAVGIVGGVYAAAQPYVAAARGLAAGAVAAGAKA